MKTNPRTPIRQALTLSLLLLALCLTMPSCSKHDEMPDEDEIPGAYHPGGLFSARLACSILSGNEWENSDLLVDFTKEERGDSIGVTLELTKVHGPSSPYLFVVPSHLRFNGIQYKIYTIGTGAFRYDTNLLGIEIPASVTEICPYAFDGCENLQQVTIYCTPEIAENAFPDGFQPTFVNP